MTTRDLIAPPETTDNWGILNENEAIQKDIVYLEYNVLVSFDPLMIEPPLIPVCAVLSIRCGQRVR